MLNTVTSTLNTELHIQNGCIQNERRRHAIFARIRFSVSAFRQNRHRIPAMAYLHSTRLLELHFIQYSIWVERVLAHDRKAKYVNYTIARPQVIKSTASSEKRKLVFFFLIFFTRRDETSEINKWKQTERTALRHTDRRQKHNVVCSFIFFLFRNVWHCLPSTTMCFRSEAQTIKRRRTFYCICSSVVCARQIIPAKVLCPFIN